MARKQGGAGATEQGAGIRYDSRQEDDRQPKVRVDRRQSKGEAEHDLRKRGKENRAVKGEPFHNCWQHQSNEKERHW